MAWKNEFLAKFTKQGKILKTTFSRVKINIFSREFNVFTKEVIKELISRFFLFFFSDGLLLRLQQLGFISRPQTLA